MRFSSTIIVLLLVIATSLALNFYQYSSLKFVTATTTTVETSYLATSTTCHITGQPAGISFRVLSDSTSEPVTGAFVAAVNRPALCNGSPASSQTVKTFTTNGTEWFPLPSDNNAGYTFFVDWSGHQYNITADLRPVSLTCATLFVSSGRANVTISLLGQMCT